MRARNCSRIEREMKERLMGWNKSKIDSELQLEGSEKWYNRNTRQEHHVKKKQDALVGDGGSRLD